MSVGTCTPNLEISHYRGMIGRICAGDYSLLCSRSRLRRLETRRRLDICGCGGSEELVSVSLRMVPRRLRVAAGACHAGEARAKAAIASRMAARSQSRAAGQADAMATLMRRKLKTTIAPILSSLRRMGPQVAGGEWVS